MPDRRRAQVDENQPNPKRVRPDPDEWVKGVVDHIKTDLVTDADLVCVVCHELPPHCPVLRSQCPDRAIMCLDCIKNDVKAHSEVINVSGVYLPRNHVSVAPPPSNHLSFLGPLDKEPDLVFNMMGCPCCRQANVAFKGDDSLSLWRRMLASVVDTVQSRAPVKMKPLCASCPCGEEHDTDSDWAGCVQSSVAIICPVDKCNKTLRLQVGGPTSLKQQVMAHISGGDCAGFLTCTHCSIHVAKTPDYQDKWHTTVSPSKWRAHMSLHARLYGLWLTFQHLETDDISPAEYKMWWSQVKTCFADQKPSHTTFGGGASFQFRGMGPRDRILSRIASNERWVRPWMVTFLESMNSVAVRGPKYLQTVAFAHFFNAGYGDFMNEQEGDIGYEDMIDSDVLMADPGLLVE